MTKPSRFFGVNFLVTIYYIERIGQGRDALYEHRIGIGRVENIQENHLIQGLVLSEGSGRTDLWQRIRKAEMTIFSQVVIKPSIDFAEAGIEDRFNG